MAAGSSPRRGSPRPSSSWKAVMATRSTWIPPDTSAALPHSWKSLRHAPRRSKPPADRPSQLCHEEPERSDLTALPVLPLLPASIFQPMPPFPERLRAAVADRYRIEEEIG